MKSTITLIFFTLFVIASLMTLIIGGYLQDMLFLGIGVLLIIASVLIFLEIKTMTDSPFGN